MLKIKSLLIGFTVTSASILAFVSLNAIPAYAAYNCSNSCWAYGSWNGTTYGTGANFYTSDPSVTGSDLFTRYLELDNGNAYIDVGITKGKFCGNYTTVDYFLYAQDSNGNSRGVACQQVPSGQRNFAEYLSMNRYTSNGGGVLVHFPTNISQCGGHNYCFVGNIPQSYGSIKVEEYITKSVSGHWVWGSWWSNFQYVDSGGTYHYQQRDFDVKHSMNLAQPPQMYWWSAPSGSNSGGSLVTCDYESGSSCTIGG